MAFKSFRLNVIARCALLGSTLLLLFYLIAQTSLYATSTALILLAAFEIYALLHYVEKTNKDLSRFLLSIRHADFTQTFSSGGRGKSFDELTRAFSEVIEQFRKVRADEEEHSVYLQTVVQHIGVGLIAFTPDGAVTLINNAAKRILGVNNLINISSLRQRIAEIADTLLKLPPGEKALVRAEMNGELVQLVVHATEMKLHGQSQTLVSVQNIQSELDEKEMEAWQKLVRVLTHEIMNSLTPISSLASTVNDMLGPGSADQASPLPISDETLKDVRGALGTIEKRSQGLLHFVDAYRSLARIPRPNFSIVPVGDLFHRVEQLMHEHLAARGIAFRASVDPKSLEITADAELVEQVLINLLRNAVEALGATPGASIDLNGRLGEGGRVVLEVSDNGPGIRKDIQDRIFVPFFTTKPNGSGIGLSLSRQIMRLHRGSITVNSDPGRRTAFALRF